MKQANVFHRVIIGLLTLTGILILAKAGSMTTDGFRMQKINPSEEHLKAYYSDDLSLFDKKLFDTPFSYLGKGGQIYCFESSDGQYVLKFLRHHKYRTPFLLKFFSFSPTVQNHLEKIMQFRKGIYQRALLSYKMAATDLKKASGTIFVHLAKTSDLKTTATIVDKAKQPHQIDLDNRFFIIQRKADKNLAKALIEKRESHDIAAARELIDSFLSSVTEMMKKQITIRDRNCLINFGETNNHVQMIDLGAFVPFDEGKDFLPFEKKTRAITKHLQRWLAKNYPELLPYAEEEIQSQLLTIKSEHFSEDKKLL